MSLRLGIPYKQLLDQLTYDELLTYQAYSLPNPIDSDTRTEYELAQIAQLIHNSNSKKSKSLDDFLLFSKKIKKSKKQTTQEMLADAMDFMRKV